MPFQKGNKLHGDRTGSPNELSRALTRGLLKSLPKLPGLKADAKGLEAWLVRLADTQPVAFAALLAKYVPARMLLDEESIAPLVKLFTKERTENVIDVSARESEEGNHGREEVRSEEEPLPVVSLVPRK